MAAPCLGAVAPERRGVANGVLGTARTLGMLLGVALAGAVYATTLSQTSQPSADTIRAASDAALLVAVLGAVTSATRFNARSPYEA